MATETEEAELTGEDLRYISEAARIRAAMDRAAAITTKQQQESAARADREAAQREWDTMVENGSTPQEATRLLGRRLYGGSPATMERAIRWSAPAPKIEVPAPRITNFPDVPNQPFVVNTDRFGQQRATRIPVPEDRGTPQPPDVKQNLLMLNKEISDKTTALEKAKAEASTTEQKGALLDLMTDLDRTKDKAVQTSTNYPGYKPNVPRGTESPYKDGTVLRNKKDGKRYRIENGIPVLLNE